jgi:hypothetical protein
MATHLSSGAKKSISAKRYNAALSRRPVLGAGGLELLGGLDNAR